MRTVVPSNQMKAITMAMAGAIVAAVAAMFVPAAMLEGFTGATGLSELLPAAAAPLGDTARAMIAFGAGAFTLAVLAAILLRQGSVANAAEAAPTALDDDMQGQTFKDRLARIALPKMPWSKGEDDITELADLPKLRNGDSHPDAPARRPLSAHQDLPVIDLAEVAVDMERPEDVVVIDAAEAMPVTILQDETVEASAPEMPAPEVPPSISAQPITQADAQPTLAEMVAQLEAAVAERQRQLAELEAVAAGLAAPPALAAETPSEIAEAQEIAPEPLRAERPPLEAVPASVKDDDMDSALAAALATLHRMNGTSR